MSGSKSKAGSNGSSIPAADRKLVSSLKEVVPHSEDEIYSMLKECNRDPDETVQRLLSQETFHVVQRKRDKKKETVRYGDGVSGNSNRSGRTIGNSGNRGLSRGSSSLRSNTNELNSGRNKLQAVKEISIPSAVTKGPSSTSQQGGKLSYSDLLQPKDSSFNHKPASDRDSSQAHPLTTPAEAWPAGPGSSTPAVLQGAWRAGTTHGTIADLLKSGSSSQRSKAPVGSGPVSTNSLSGATEQPSASNMCLSSSDPVLDPPLNPRMQPHVTMVEGIGTHHLNVDEPSTLVQDNNTDYFSVTVNRIAPPPVGRDSDASKLHTDSNMSVVSEEQPHNPSVATDGDAIPSETEDQYASSSAVQCNTMPTDHSVVSWIPHVAHDEGHVMESSSVTTDLETLSSSLASPSTEDLLTATIKIQGLNIKDNQQVIIPDHIRIPEADRPMLSFGSFDSGFDDISSQFNSGQNTLFTLTENATEDDTAVDESISRTENESSEDVLEQDHSNDAVGTQDSGQTVIEIQESREEASLRQTSHDSYSQSILAANIIPSQADNGSHYSAEVAESRPLDINKPLQSYDNSTYYSGMFQSTPEVDTRYSPFLQSAPATNAVSTNRPGSTGRSPSSQELSSSVGYANSNLQGTASVANIQTSMTHSQQTLPIPAYTAQPSGLPMGPFANVFSYPYMPPGFSYLQSPYQPNLMGAGNYHHLSSPALSAAGMKYPLPQLKATGTMMGGMHNTITPGALGYGGYPTSQPGSYPVNPPATVGNSSSFDDNTSQSYKEANVYIPNQQQMEGPSVWLQSQLAREVPGNSYYNISSQNQQSRYSQPQNQSLAHTHPAAVYGNLYHPQQSASTPTAHQLLQQQQALGSLAGQAGSYHPAQRAQQTWANGF